GSAWGYPVGAGPKRGERLDDGLVRIRLHGVADEGARIAERVGEHFIMTPESGGRVAIERGCDRLRQINEIDRLGGKHAVAIDEMVHGEDSVEQPVDGGGPVRCFWRGGGPGVGAACRRRGPPARDWHGRGSLPVAARARLCAGSPPGRGGR